MVPTTVRCGYSDLFFNFCLRMETRILGRARVVTYLVIWYSTKHSFFMTPVFILTWTVKTSNVVCTRIVSETL